MTKKQRFTCEPCQDGVRFNDTQTDSIVVYQRASRQWTICVPNTGGDYDTALDIAKDFAEYIRNRPLAR